MKSLLSIQKEMLKKEYDKTELGQLQKKIGKFYNQVKENQWILPDNLLKQVNDIRNENEKAQMEYIERTNREHREYLDQTLLESMSKEWSLLEKYQNDK
mgnify:CR=1 FL=1